MTTGASPLRSGRPILACVELDGSSDAAIAIARDLAEQYGTELVLANVYTAPSYPHLGQRREVIPSEGAAYAAAATAGLAALAAANPGARTVLREGFPADVLPEIVREIDPALVVVGFHGRTGVARMILGSVAETLVRNCTAPVLVARA